MRECEGKLDSEDKQKVEEEVSKVLSWVEKNQLAEKDEYEHKLEELQKLCTPIMTKLHAAGSSGKGPMPNGSQGPTVEEVN